MAFTMAKRHVHVLDSYISYVDTRAGEDTIIWLHGNPSSSYIWRHMFPKVSSFARGLAPDLLGYGNSGKHPHHVYTFNEHYRYFCAWMDAVKVSGPLIFICHEFGSMLAFRWCSLYPDRVKAIIHMESIPAPLDSIDDLGSKEAANTFWAMRTDPAMEEKVIRDNAFLESWIGDLTTACKHFNNKDAEMYRQPFTKEGEGRRPMLTAAQQMPLTSEGPEDVINLVFAYNQWLKQSNNVPKLYLHTNGGLGTFAWNKACDWPNQKRVDIKGSHHVPQEGAPDQVTAAILAFIREHVEYKSVIVK